MSMPRASLTIALGATLWLVAATAASALGFGSTKTTTSLGQPLNFAASLSLDASESLARECVSAIVHAGEGRVPPGNVRVALEPAGDGNGRIVRVTTTTLIDEPVVTVEITVGCSSSMSRRFVSFVDPPLVNLAQAQELAPPPVLQASAAAPIVDIVRAADASRRRSAAPVATGEAVPELQQRRAARRAAPRAERLVAAATRPAGEPLQRSTGSSRSARRSGAATFAAAPSRGAPRLRLEASPPRLAAASAPPAPLPATVLAAATPAASAPSAAAPAAQASTPPAATTLATIDPAGEALRRERERIQVLEAGMARLGGDAQAMQQSVATLQARLRDAENDRYANGLVYALAAGMIFFAALAVALYLLRPRQRRRAQWFDASKQQGAPRNPPPAPRPAAAARDTGPASQPAERSWSKGPPSILPVTAPATIGGLDVTMVLGPEPYRPLVAAGTAAPAAAASPRRSASTSMEELIDMEQQAEFFVVLGQDEAAIELLGAHVEGGGRSPLPFLKLLEIHQRRDDRAAYEQVREAFKERFHARAPEWSADLQQGRSLEQYPTTIARLQALWATPMQAMQVLDGLLFRRHEGDEAYDFPAYRELLFLYSIARELAGQVETDFGPIDLFLPLDGSDGQAPVYSDSANTIDLDISNWPGEASTESMVIRRSPGRRGAA